MRPTVEEPPAPDPGFRRTTPGWRSSARRPAALAALTGAVALAGALIWLISPQLRASGGAAVRRSGPWVTVTARRPGTYELTAPY